jgi:hypothetical protein
VPERTWSSNLPSRTTPSDLRIFAVSIVCRARRCSLHTVTDDDHDRSTLPASLSDGYSRKSRTTPTKSSNASKYNM